MRTALLAVAALALPALASPEIALETRSIPPALLLAEVLPQPAGHPFVRDLVTRQLTDSTIPSACKSVCGSTVQIYEACTGSRTQANRDTCLSVCQQSVFTEYTSCLQCAVDNIQGGFTASELRLLQGAVDDLQETCADEGQTVTAPSLTRGSSTGTVTATRTATATSTVSITRTTGTLTPSSAPSVASNVVTSESASAAISTPAASSAPAATSQSSAVKMSLFGASAGLAMLLISLSTVCAGLVAM